MNHSQSPQRAEETNQPHSRYPHVYAIVRFDRFISRDNLANSATVVKVVRSQDVAEQEAAKLNEVNKGKDCLYCVQITRLVEDAPGS